MRPNSSAKARKTAKPVAKTTLDSSRSRKNAPSVNSADALQKCEKAALNSLLTAHDRASALGKDIWQFAVERSTLQAAGASDIDLRALVCQGSIESRR